MIAKINVFNPLLERTNIHCGCVELVEYIPFDYLHVAFGVWIKKLVFFKWLGARACATVAVQPFLYSTRPPHLPNPKSHAPTYAATLLPWKPKERRGRIREERREKRGELGHEAVHHCRSSAEIGRPSFALHIFP